MYKLKENRTEKTSEIILSGPLTIRELAKIKNLFQKALQKGNNITIDLREGEDFDIALLQLFISLNKSCSDEGISISFQTPLPQAYIELVNLSGCVAYTWLLDNSETEEMGEENE